MKKLNQYLADYVYLAEASYADFSKGYDGDKVKAAIGNGDKDLGIKGQKKPESFAELVTNNYKVIAHWKDRDDESSFSGTLFQAKNTGEYVLALKGSKELKDLWTADKKHIVDEGLAYKQIVDLYNFWQQIKTGKGSTYKAVKITHQSLEADIIKQVEKEVNQSVQENPNLTNDEVRDLIDKSITNFLQSFVNDRNYLMEKSDKITISNNILKSKENLIDGLMSWYMTPSKSKPLFSEALIGNNNVIDHYVDYISFDNSDKIYNDERKHGLGIEPKNVVVTGHSLGGHLSAAFSRLFENETDYAYMVNGAGFGRFTRDWKVNEVFSLLNGKDHFDVNKITNFVGDKNIDFVANDWPVPLGLRQPGEKLEVFIESDRFFSSDIGGHAANLVTDTMAVIDLFVRLDKDLQDKPVDELLDMMNRILRSAEKNDKFTLESVVNRLSKQLTGTDPHIAEGDRNEFYKEVIELHKFIDKEYPNGSLHLSSIDGITINAQKDEAISARYALKHLNSFILEGDKLYADDGILKDELPSLQLFNPETARDGMTSEYILSRGAVLSEIARINTYNPNGVLYVKDMESGFFIDNEKRDPISGKADSIDKRSHYVFGAKDDDNIEGSKNSDLLFGGDGKDNLDGKEGDDYLEGGKGFDTYQVKDEDRILDSDMSGEIHLGEINLSGRHFINHHGLESWYLQDKNGKLDSSVSAWRDGNNLMIQHGNDKAEIVDFFVMAKSEQTKGGIVLTGLSITLETTDITPTLSNIHEHPSDEILVVMPNKYAHVYGSNGENWIIGGAKGDTMFLTTAERNVVDAAQGDDLIIGGGFADEFHGGEGNDVIYGAPIFHNNKTAHETIDDKDIIFGGAGHDSLMGVGGNDIIYADDVAAVTAPGTPGKQGDWLLGNKGQDSLYGAQGDDFLNGGEGGDVILGGGGDDVILGDGDVRFEKRSASYVSSGGSVTTPVYHDGTPVHPWISPGVTVSQPTHAGHALSFEYYQENDKWAVRPMSSLYTLHRSSSDWTLSIDRENGDYSIEYNQTLPKIRNNTHRVAEGGGNDHLYGGAGDDLIIGQDGNDLLFGQEGDDILWGDDNRDPNVSGNDVLVGGAGEDKLFGGKGNDHLYAGSGNDFLQGGEDSDRYYFSLEDFQALDINTVDDDGKDANGQLDLIYLDKKWLSEYNWQYEREKGNSWYDENSGYRLQRQGTTLMITHQGNWGRVEVKNYADGDYGLTLRTNQNPEVVKPISPLRTTTNKEWHHTFDDNLFRDPDGDALSYRMENLPAGLSFDPTTRTLTGTPQQAGDYTLKLIADDGHGGTASQTIHLSVAQSNQAPVVVQTIGDLIADTDNALHYVFDDNLFRDPDGDALSYRMENLPAGLSFDPATRTLTGTPQQAGDYTLKLIADDGHGGTASQTIHLNVAHVNHAPEAQEKFATQNLTLRAEWHWTLPDNMVIDADGDPLTYRLADGAPAWLNINPNGEMYATPPAVGQYDVPIIADDGHGGQTTFTLNLNVTAPDDVTVHHGFALGGFGDDKLHGSDNNDTLRGMTGNDELFGWGGNDYLVGGLGNDILHGGEGDDRLDGSLGDDTLLGDAGNDILYGQWGNDTLYGGKGNDHMEGGFGDDVYHFTRGDGQDIINEIGGNDSLILQDIRLEELLISYSGGDMTIAIAGSDEKVTIQQWDKWFGRGKIETLKLANATLNSSQLEHYADSKMHTLEEFQRDYGIL